MLKKLLIITGAAVAGIYLTSEEGKKAREGLLKKKNAFQPIISDLTQRATEALEESKEINSKEVKANIEHLVDEAKQIIVDIDLDKTVEMIKEAIQVASKKIRKAIQETEKSNIKSNKKPKINILGNEEIKKATKKPPIQKNVKNSNKIITKPKTIVKKKTLPKKSTTVKKHSKI